MKLSARFLLSSLALSALLTGSVSAAALSPGLCRIAENSSMIKSGTVSTGISFSTEDFQRASMLTEVEAVTVTSLPASSCGVLYFGNVPLAVNQSISGENLDKLHFSPTGDAREGSFTFRYGEDYSVKCILRITDEINFAPTVATSPELAAWTQKDIDCCGTLKAYDPEGDPLQFEITSYPSKGLLTLRDAEHGDFTYTPYSGYSGEDHFSYRVRDSYGNYSDTAVVTVTIERQNTEFVFADMNGHWAHSAAITMASDGIIEYTHETGMALFRPEEKVTRQEFLMMVMRALDYEPDILSVETVFADNDQISQECKPYVNAAFNAGIIRGREENGQILFCPSEYISRAESAVIVNNIIGAEVPVTVSLFTDNDTVPAWAQSALYALHHLGILKGTGAGAISPFDCITRAQAAQILLNFTQYIG